MAQNNATPAEMKPVYYYFGVIRYVNKRRVVSWGKPHATAHECAEANIEYMAGHVGCDFMIQRFDRLIGTSAPE